MAGAALLPLAAAPLDWAGLAARWIAPLRDAVAALPGPGLIRSYETRIGPDAAAFDRVHANCAYVYDNAVAGLALLASGLPDLARRIATALADAQAHDRFWTDGRLRNAYAAGPAARPAALPGWWDAPAARWLEDGTQAGTSTGVLAWAMLLWTALGAEYRAPAERAADWMARTVATPTGLLGGFVGHEPDPTRLTWASTEHNLDAAVALARLGRPDAATAAAFVERMWDPAEARYLSGLRPDGSPNTHSAVDANVWPLLAGGKHRGGLDWVLSRHALPEGAPRAEVDGVDFDTDRDGIWLEGTAIAALALRRGDESDQALARRLAATLAANTAPSGLVFAATTPTLTTGLSTGLDPSAPDFLYFRRPHVAATAWAALAALGVDPLG